MGTQRAAYEAVNTIYFNGVRAYNAGDPVDAAVVDGPEAWVDPEDVKPSGVIALEQPGRGDSHARWANYAVSLGDDPAEAADASRADLIARHGGEGGGAAKPAARPKAAAKGSGDDG